MSGPLSSDWLSVPSRAAPVSSPHRTPHPRFRQLSRSAWLPDCLRSCEPSTLPLVPQSLSSVTCADSTLIPLLDSIQCFPAHVFTFCWLCVSAVICVAPFAGWSETNSKRLSNYSFCLNYTTPSTVLIHSSICGSSSTTETTVHVPERLV